MKTTEYDIRKKHQEIVTDIIHNYFWDNWSDITHISLNYIPDDLKRLHNRVRELQDVTPLQSDEEVEKMIDELKQIRNTLKRTYKKLEKKYRKKRKFTADNKGCLLGRSVTRWVGALNKFRCVQKGNISYVKYIRLCSDSYRLGKNGKKFR